MLLTNLERVKLPFVSHILDQSFKKVLPFTVLVTEITIVKKAKGLE